MGICPPTFGIDAVINAVVNAACIICIEQTQRAATNATLKGVNVTRFLALIKNKLSKHGDPAVVWWSKGYFTDRK